MSETEPVPPGVDASKPSPARMYDRYLGGTANFAADRDAVDRILELVPEIRDAAWANRGFLQRAVRWMAERGIRQFIDLGAGLPTQRCTHEVARAVAPDARVLYTDIDPSVIAHGEQILADVPGTAVIEADFRRPDDLLGHPVTRRLIDFTEPAGLLIVAVTQFIPDADDPWSLVAALHRRAGGRVLPGPVRAHGRPHGDAQGGADPGGLRHLHDPVQHAPQPGRDRAVLRRARHRAAVPGHRSRPDHRWPVGLRGSRGGRERGLALVLCRGRPQAADRRRAAGPGQAHRRRAAIDTGRLVWQQSSEGPRAIEVAFAWVAGEEWILLRLNGYPDERVSVFSRFEWDCFLAGVRNGQFDGVF